MDVWVGTAIEKYIDAIMVIIDLLKRDSEIKILISCTEEEKNIIYQTHNETPYMKRDYDSQMIQTKYQPQNCANPVALS